MSTYTKYVKISEFVNNELASTKVIAYDCHNCPLRDYINTIERLFTIDGEYNRRVGNSNSMLLLMSRRIGSKRYHLVVTGYNINGEPLFTNSLLSEAQAVSSLSLDGLKDNLDVPQVEYPVATTSGNSHTDDIMTWLNEYINNR